MTGPLRALWWWITYAASAHQAAKFVGKADDDIYVHLSDVVMHLASIPIQSREMAVYGVASYFQLTTIPGAYEIHSYATTAKHSRTFNVARHLRCNLPNASSGGGAGSRSSSSSSSSGSSSSSDLSMWDNPLKQCYGPFPFACGPFYALGAGVVRALLQADGQVLEDLERIKGISSCGHLVPDSCPLHA